MEMETKEALENDEENTTRKCASLQKQIDLLVAANKALGAQLKQQTAQVRKLVRAMEQVGIEQGNGQNSFSVFPEELWEIILEYLSDSQDLLRVCRTCNQLDAVLHSEKGTWMFELVVKNIFKWLPRQDILTCRVICKKWTAAIDHLIENHPSRRPFSQNSLPDDNLLNSLKLTNSATFHLWDSDRIRSLREKMRKHPRNPFIGRSVVFNVEIDDDFDDDEVDPDDDPGITEFWDLTRAFLGSLGYHIWYVEITEDSGHQKPLEFYKLLRELLIFLPNLRSLKLAVDISHEDYHPKALPLYMANSPLPVMPHLESLDLECLYAEVPQIIHDMLLAMYSPQLLKLHLNMTRWKASYSRGLTRLTEFHVREVSLEKLSLLTTPMLGKICLDLRESSTSFASRINPRSVHALMETLSRFSTLQAIKLLVDITVELEEIDGATRQLCCNSTVQQVEVHGIQRKISYSFLLCFPSLKYITVCESTSSNKFNEDPAVIAFLEGDSQSRQETVQVQKYMYTRRMSESNIWEEIPSLKAFSFLRIKYGDVVFKHNCTRETYEYRKLMVEQGTPTPTNDIAN